MKYGITCNPYHASSVRPDTSKRIFTLTREGHGLLLSIRRGAEDNAVRVVGIVVAVASVAVDVIEVVAVVRRTKPVYSP